LAVTVLPTAAVPLIVGGELFDGATVERETTAPAVPATTSAERPTLMSTRRADHFIRSNPFLRLPMPDDFEVSLAKKAAITARASEVLTKS